ncbi:unnamed protein product, partial [Darwinula stevensoni]
QNGDEPVSTLTQDFHTRLDNLLRTLVHAKPHFIRCVRANAQEIPERFDRLVVGHQIRSLQVLETVNLMAGGFPHRMRFKAFRARYKLLAPMKQLVYVPGSGQDDKVIEDCRLLLDYFGRAIDDHNGPGNLTINWAIGTRHIFISEGARQKLEKVRMRTRERASTLIQSVWRGWHLRRRWPGLQRQLQLCTPTRIINPHAPNSNTVSQGPGSNHLGGSTRNRPRPQPIAGTPPPEAPDKCDPKAIQQTCSRFGLDLAALQERPPPLPPSRSYTITGNTKLGYPQTRVMKASYPEDGTGDEVLLKGETVVVIGAGHRRGYLMVEHKGHVIQVPYQYLELKPAQIGVDI